MQKTGLFLPLQNLSVSAPIAEREAGIGTAGIIARRSIQRRLDTHPDTSRRERNREAREAPEQPERRPPRGNVEVVVFSTLAKCGNLKHEQPLPSGAMPDILLQSRDVNFVADITCVSDDGLDELNPYEEFFRLVSDLKTNLGLPGGGLDVRIASDRDERTTLRLPSRKELHHFVQTEIRPRIREQMAANAAPIRVSIDDARSGIEVTINPARSMHSYGSYAPYDAPTKLDSNPLYDAMKAKASGQLKAAKGVTGIIVGDGNSAGLGDDRPGLGAHSPTQIARELLWRLVSRRHTR